MKLNKPKPQRFIIRNLVTGQYYGRKKWVVDDPVNHPFGDGKDVYFRDDPNRAKIFHSRAAAKNACRYIHQLTQYKVNDCYKQDLDLDHNLEIIEIED